MSAYSDAIAELDFAPFTASPTGGALYYYEAKEGAGATNLENSGRLKSVAAGGVVPNMVPNGAVQLGVAADPPLAAGQTNARNLKDTHLAHRNDSALLDRPAGPIGDPSKYSILALVDLTKLKGKAGASSGGYALVQKGSRAQLLLRGTSIQFHSEGMSPTGLILPANAIAAGGRYLVVGSFDAAVGRKLNVNGVDLISQTFGSIQPSPTWSNGGTLDIGGSAGFESGLWGDWAGGGMLYSYALAHTSAGLAQIRKIYAAALGLGAIAGVGFAFPWPTTIVGANANRSHLTIQNPGTMTVYLGLDGNDAVAGSIRKISPYVGEWEAPPGYEGPVSVVLAEPLGYNRLLIDER